MHKRIIPALVLICLIGCASRHATVSHVVVCWLKTPGDESARQKVIDASHTFRKIPGVISIDAGRAIPSTRPIVDSTFDVAIVMQFRDEKALQDYAENPIHKKAASEVLRPLTAKILIYDIKYDEGSSPQETTKPLTKR